MSALDDLDLTVTQPAKWESFKLNLSRTLDKFVCFFLGHKWETQGGKSWTDYGWEYDAYTECSRCGTTPEEHYK